MNNPVLDSLLFLTVARSTLCEYFETFEVDHLSDIRRFIKKEATDYQVMELMVTGNLPDDRHNPDREHRLWEALKQSIIMENEGLLEALDDDLVQSFLFEMGPVYEYGLSSASPILEFHIKSGVIEKIGWQIGDVRRDRKTGKRLDAPKQTPKNTASKKKVSANKDAAKGLVKTAGDYWKKQLAKVGIKSKPKKQVVRKKIEEPPKKKEVVAKTAPPAKKKGDKKPAPKPVASNKAPEGKVTPAASDDSSPPPKKDTEKRTPVTQAVKDAIKDRWNKLSPQGKGAAKATAAIGAAALIGIAANKIYQKHFSKAAKACKGSDDKTACMAKFKADARSAKIAKLKAGLGKCKNYQCKATVQRKIDKEVAKGI